MHDHGSAATAMLGLAGFVLLAVSENEGELEQAIETTASEDFCRGCGVQARLHDRRPTWVRDLPSGGRAVTLVWVKRVWRCVEAGCPVATWTETSAQIRARAGGDDRAGPRRGVPAGRRGRARGGRGGGRVRRVSWLTGLSRGSCQPDFNSTPIGPPASQVCQRSISIQAFTRGRSRWPYGLPTRQLARGWLGDRGPPRRTTAPRHGRMSRSAASHRSPGNSVPAR